MLENDKFNAINYYKQACLQGNIISYQRLSDIDKNEGRYFSFFSKRVLMFIKALRIFRKNESDRRILDFR